MPGQQGEVNQPQHVVHGVVMLGDAQGPADHCPVGAGIGPRQLANRFRRDARNLFRVLRRVLLYTFAEFVEPAGRILDKAAILQPQRQNLPRYRIGQRDICPHVQSQPFLGELGRAGPPGIHDEQPRPVMQPLQHMMEEDRMRLAGVRSPQDDKVRLFYLAIGTGAATGSKDRRQTDDARSVSSTVAAVYIVAADHRSRELLCNEVHLVGRLRAAEHPEALRTMRFDRAAKALCSAVQRFIPACRTQLAVLADQRSGEA